METAPFWSCYSGIHCVVTFEKERELGERKEGQRKEGRKTDVCKKETRGKAVGVVGALWQAPGQPQMADASGQVDLRLLLGWATPASQTRHRDGRTLTTAKGKMQRQASTSCPSNSTITYYHLNPLI